MSDVAAKANRYPEYVIFLGAGASCSEGAPSQADLFRTAFSQNLQSDFDPDHHLRGYFRDFWGIDIDSSVSGNSVFPTLEEALGLLELAKMRQEAFKGYYSTANQRSIDHTIEDLIYLISKTLKHALEGSTGYHEVMVRNLASSGLLRHCCFISLNYDILIDNALITAKDVCDIDYGIEFMNYEHRGIGGDGNWDKPDPDKAVKLLKIHGSLNWLYCPVCDQIKITPGVKAAVDLAYVARPKPRCGICEGHFAPILIPPTYYKDMSKHFLSSIWYSSEQALMKCKRIVFCGYSLPDADMHIKYLLKRGSMNRRSQHPEIVVLNGYKGKPQQAKKEEKYRYLRLLGNQVDYQNSSFQDFSRKPSSFLR